MKPKYFDVHTHVNLKSFKKRESEIIKQSLKEDVWLINVGTDNETSLKAGLIAKKYIDGVYATVGFHPNNVLKKEMDIEDIFSLSTSDKVVAIGECGLDYFYTDDKKVISMQREVFDRQIEIANKTKKPLMLHIRDGSTVSAYVDAISMLKKRSLFGGNVHFFSGSLDNARDFLSLGFTLSFTGVVTFVDYDALVRFPPLDMIMSETDAPYVAPASKRGEENRPVYVKEVAHKIAEIRPEPDGKVLEALVDNACRVFGI